MNHSELLKLIQARMRELGLNPFKLYKLLSGRVSKQTVYNFVEHGKPAKTDTLIAILDVLGLSIGAELQQKLLDSRSLPRRHSKAGGK